MNLSAIKEQAATELTRILSYWAKQAMDKKHGGVYGKIDNDNKVSPKADKGAVLHARVLWTFSAAYNQLKEKKYKATADKVFEYLSAHFIDQEHGGVYWTVDYTGQPAATKKQVYAQAFAIYAFSEYYKASGKEEAKTMAIELYHLLQKYSYDTIKGGYFEAFTRDWQPIEDLRLSDKDANEKKTMNTHLHVLEAYACLYTIWRDDSLAVRLQQLLQVFAEKIIDPYTGHLHLFFDEDWNVKGDTVSYGHDIEASWLLLEAAEIIEAVTLSLSKVALTDQFKSIALKMTDATTGGLDADGGLWYEYEPAQGQFIKEKHWWPQAEAVVGFINAWQVSGQEKYAGIAIHTWQFITEHIIDQQQGEWYWGVTEDYSIMNEDKVGLWKCPYHNGRACLELIKRLP
jgi:mannobiose 2-epimerase